MGRLFVQFLSGPRVYCCRTCGCHLASSEELLSKNFHSRNGTAYLFETAINITYGQTEEREMTTGKHEVRDLYCLGCNWLLGWQYEYAHERREKYKEGKVILEKVKICSVEEGSTPSSASSSSSLGNAFDTMSLVSDVDEGCYL